MFSGNTVDDQNSIHFFEASTKVTPQRFVPSLNRTMWMFDCTNTWKQAVIRTANWNLRLATASVKIEQCSSTSSESKSSVETKSIPETLSVHDNSTTATATQTVSYRYPLIINKLNNRLPIPHSFSILATAGVATMNAAGYQLSQKMMMSSRLLECGLGAYVLNNGGNETEIDEAVERVTFDSAPLQLHVGKFPLHQHRGAVAFNPLVLVIFAAALALVTYIYQLAARKSSYKSASKMTHNPGCNAVAMGLVTAGSAYSLGVLVGGLGTNFAAPGSLDLILIAVGVVFLVVLPVALHYKAAAYCKEKEELVNVGDESSDDEDDDEKRNNNNKQSKNKSAFSIKRLVKLAADYCTDPWMEWKETSWMLRFGCFFVDGHSKPMFCVLDLVVPIAIGFTSGLSFFCEADSCCQNLAMVNAAVSLIHFGLFLFLQPFMMRLDVCFNALATGVTFLQCALVLVGLHGMEDTMTEPVEILSQVGAGLGFVMFFFSFLPYAVKLMDLVERLNSRYCPKIEGAESKSKKKKSTTKEENDDLQPSLKKLVKKRKVLKRKQSSSSLKSSGASEELLQPQQQQQQQTEMKTPSPAVTMKKATLSADNLQSLDWTFGSFRSKSKQTVLLPEQQQQPKRKKIVSKKTKKTKDVSPILEEVFSTGDQKGKQDEDLEKYLLDYSRDELWTQFQI
jgi:Na+-transporting methylmalonyl-CoA/oxaloacetate decarboxylase gamma subunit